MRKKHESTTRKRTKYTVNKNKFSLPFFSLVQLSRFNNMDELLLRRMLGPFTHLARCPCGLVLCQFSRVMPETGG